MLKTGPRLVGVLFVHSCVKSERAKIKDLQRPTRERLQNSESSYSPSSRRGK